MNDSRAFYSLDRPLPYQSSHFRRSLKFFRSSFFELSSPREFLGMYLLLLPPSRAAKKTSAQASAEHIVFTLPCPAAGRRMQKSLLPSTTPILFPPKVFRKIHGVGAESGAPFAKTSPPFFERTCFIHLCSPSFDEIFFLFSSFEDDPVSFLLFYGDKPQKSL